MTTEIQPVGPLWWRPVMQLPGALVLALAFILGAQVRNGRQTPGFDLATLRWFEQVRTPWMVTLGRWIEFVDGPTATPWLLVLAGVLIVVRGHRMLGVCVVLLVAFAWYPGHVAKSVFPRDRPPASVSPALVVTGANSFPSGHTGFITSVFVAGLFALAALGRRRGWWGVVVGLVVVLVGCSRMLVGVHYPTDVVGGAMLAVGAGLVLWPIFAGLLYTVPPRLTWLRDTRATTGPPEASVAEGADAPRALDPRGSPDVPGALDARRSPDVPGCREGRGSAGDRGSPDVPGCREGPGRSGDRGSPDVPGIQDVPETLEGPNGFPGPGALG